MHRQHKQCYTDLQDSEKKGQFTCTVSVFDVHSEDKSRDEEQCVGEYHYGVASLQAVPIEVASVEL